MREQTQLAVDATSLPFERRVVGAILAQAVERSPSKIFIRFNGRSVSYGEFGARVDAVAGGLWSLGARKGTRIAFMMRNSIEFLECMFAAARLGAIYVPLNTDYLGDILAHQLGRSGARIVVVEQEFLDRVDRIREKVPELEHTVVRSPDGARIDTTERPSSTFDFRELTSRAVPIPEVPVAPSDPFVINFTSGTTGPSKGVLATHCHVVTFALDWIHACGVLPEDRLYTPLPLFHAIAAWLGVIPAMIVGTEIAIAERFSANRFWDDVRAHGSTVVHGIFSIIPILLKQPPRPDDKDVPARLFYIGQRNREFEERFGCRIIELYGATETGIVTFTPIGETAPPGSCGRPNGRTYEVEILDDEDRPVPAGVVGQIAVRPRQPYSIMEGYYREPEASLEAFRNLWFHTGDNAKRDDSGYFYFVDRKKDGIRRRGENIASFEVESVIARHQAVLECAVVAAPSLLGEDDIHAVVVRRPGADLTAAELWAFCEQAMPRFWVPRYIEFRDMLPKTANQKIQKYLLRAGEDRGEMHDREVKR